MAKITPIKIPAGASRNEPSWKAELKRIADEWAAGGGMGGYFKRSLNFFLQWRGPSGKPPQFVQGALGSQGAKGTNLENKYIGPGVWFSVECLTRQTLWIFLPDLNEGAQSEGSMFRKGNWLVQFDFTGNREVYAPKTVVALLQLGYPKGA